METLLVAAPFRCSLLSLLQSLEGLSRAFLKCMDGTTVHAVPCTRTMQGGTIATVVFKLMECSRRIMDSLFTQASIEGTTTACMHAEVFGTTTAQYHCCDMIDEI